jgi:hypothetical protein
MFHDLDETLAELLNRELHMVSVALSFATPDDQFPPASVTFPAIDLFLYDVRENVALRSNEWHETHSNGQASRERAPVRVDCSYLITAWSGQSDPVAAIKDEHYLLGEVMRVLLRHKKLPADVLQGELAHQEPPVRAKIIRDGYLQSLGEFWQAMGGKPKAALNYTVTISVPVGEPEPLGPLVETHHIRLQTKEKE